MIYDDSKFKWFTLILRFFEIYLFKIHAFDAWSHSKSQKLKWFL